MKILNHHPSFSAPPRGIPLGQILIPIMYSTMYLYFMSFFIFIFVIVGLVEECCCHGQSFPCSLMYEVRLILLKHNSKQAVPRQSFPITTHSGWGDIPECAGGDSKHFRRSHASLHGNRRYVFWTHGDTRVGCTVGVLIIGSGVVSSGLPPLVRLRAFSYSFSYY